MRTHGQGSDDGPRRCRLGSFAFADAHGVCGSARVVRLGRSRVCDGRGLFAARFLPRGTPITRYHGRVVRAAALRRLGPDESLYVYELAGGARCIVGALFPAPGEGLGQLANDAVHPEVTFRDNNAHFSELPDGRVYVTALRDIRPGEEILASYHISYWLHWAERDDALRASPTLREWARVHRRAERMLQRLYGGECNIEDYHGRRGLPIEAPPELEQKVAVREYTVRLPPATREARRRRRKVGAGAAPRCACDDAGLRLRRCYLSDRGPDRDYAFWCACALSPSGGPCCPGAAGS